MSELMSAPPHTLHHNTTVTHIHPSYTPSQIYSYTSFCNVAHPSGAGIENGLNFRLYPLNSGVQLRNCNEGSH